MNAPVASLTHLFWSFSSGLSVVVGSPMPVSPSNQIGALWEIVARIVALNRSLVFLNERPHVDAAIRESAEKRLRLF